MWPPDDFDEDEENEKDRRLRAAKAKNEAKSAGGPRHCRTPQPQPCRRSRRKTEQCLGSLPFLVFSLPFTAFHRGSAAGSTVKPEKSEELKSSNIFVDGDRTASSVLSLLAPFLLFLRSCRLKTTAAVRADSCPVRLWQGTAGVAARPLLLARRARRARRKGSRNGRGLKATATMTNQGSWARRSCLGGGSFLADITLWSRLLTRACAPTRRHAAVSLRSNRNTLRHL